MFIRNGKVTGSVLHSAVPTPEAEKPKPPPAAKKPTPAPVKKQAAPAPAATKKEVNIVDNDDASK